jgi:AAA domain
MHTAYALSQGRSVFGRRVHPVRVLYLACEGRSGLRARIEALVAEHGQSADFLAIAQPVDLWSTADDTDMLIAAIQRERIGLLVVDTLNRVMGGGDENSSADMGAVIHALDRIRAETGMHVAVVHHGTKNGTGGPRGHGSLAGAADAVIEVITAEDGSRVAILRDVKDEVGGGTLGFRLHVVELGYDADGDPRTSCIVSAGEPQQTQPTTLRLSTISRLVLEQLERAVIDEGRPPPASPNIPGDVRIVPFEMWRSYAYRGGITASDTKGAKQKAFRRAFLDLKDKMRIGTWDDFVWLTARPDSGHDRTISGLSGSVRCGTCRADDRTDTDTPL